MVVDSVSRRQPNLALALLKTPAVVQRGTGHEANGHAIKLNSLEQRSDREEAQSLHLSA